MPIQYIFASCYHNLNHVGNLVIKKSLTCDGFLTIWPTTKHICHQHLQKTENLDIQIPPRCVYFSLINAKYIIRNSLSILICPFEAHLSNRLTEI